MPSETYASALKKIIKFTKIKFTYLAEHIGYDVSYISKWSSGAKLPSSRAIDRINTEIGVYFANSILRQEKKELFCKMFVLPADTKDLAFEITQYLNNAYRATLQTQQVHTSENRSTVRMVTGNHNISQFFSEILQKRLHTLTGEQELIIYGEFFSLYDAGFWSYLDTPTLVCSRMKIQVGLNLDRLEKNPQEVATLYMILNKYLNYDFTFYDMHDMEDACLIILKNEFVIQYAIQSSQGITLCTYTDTPVALHDIYERFCIQKLNKKALLTTLTSPWSIDSGYRSAFYATYKFFFFLTNGLEYLLPSSVFDDMMKQLPPEKFFSIERLRITWEELLNKAELHIMMPTTSLMRYLETGYIDLTDIEYKMNVDERKAHIANVLATMKKNPKITAGVINLSSKIPFYQEANLSFYSNYKTSFFKKNPQHIQNESNPFYVILAPRLHAILLNFFQQLKESSQYREYSQEELSQKYTVYTPLIEKFFSLHS